MMESSLHIELKRLHGPHQGGREEARVEGLRIDAVDASGVLVEIQLGSLAALRRKLDRLLHAGHRVRVVRPIVTSRRIVRRLRVDGPDQSARMSPKRGAAVDVFEHLVGLAGVFPRDRLSVEVLEVQIDEVRVPSRRWPGHRVVDRRLRELGDRIILSVADDLWQLLPPGLRDEVPTFTTRDLARRLGRPDWFAQRVAYCLRKSGAVAAAGFDRRRRCYAAPA